MSKGTGDSHCVYTPGLRVGKKTEESNVAPPMCAKDPVWLESQDMHQKKQQPAQAICDQGQMSLPNCQILNNMKVGGVEDGGGAGDAKGGFHEESEFGLCRRYVNRLDGEEAYDELKTR